MLVVVLSVLASISVSGCAESHERTDGPIPLEHFCAAFFDAMCEPLAECGCSASAVALCRQREVELCAGFPSAALVDAVAHGRMRYDAQAARALIDRMRARSDVCESFADAVDWRVRDLFDIGGVFAGSLGAGERCSVLGFELLSECARGSCTPIDGTYVCRTAVGPGAPCDATHQCADLDVPVTMDIAVDRLSLRCGEDGTCAPRIADGGRCMRSADCESGLCEEGVCRSRVLGETCSSSRECASGYCSATERRCASGDAPAGAACESPAACASHVCVAGTCLPSGCGTF